MSKLQIRRPACRCVPLQPTALPNIARDEATHTQLKKASTKWKRFTSESAVLCGILAVTGAVYLRCLENAFVLDDVIQIAKNPNLGEWSFLWKAFTRNEFWYSDATFLEVQQFKNYRPLILVWYWINYRLFGLNPAPWHASILAVYLITVWLVFKVSRRLAGDSTPALLAAAVFALTPVHAGALGWMAPCGYVLGTALTLVAFYLVMPGAGISLRNWAAAIALYAGALLCHESMTIFPALVAAYAFIFAETPALSARLRRVVVLPAPFAVELLLYFVTRRLVLGFFITNPYFRQNLLTDAQAVLTAPWVLATYLTMLAMPWFTLPNHRVFPVSSPSAPEFWVPLAAIALLVSAFLILVGRSSRKRLYLFCAAWIGVTVAPMLALHSMPHLVQDYYLYLPSIGWSLLLGDSIAVVARKNALARRLAFGGAVAMLVVYAIALWKVERFWHDDVAAARGYLQGFPESVQWRWNLASHLDQQGDMAQAEQELRIALRMEPDRTGLFHPEASQLHHYLGELLARRGDVDGAVAEFATSVSDVDASKKPHSTMSPASNDEGASMYYEGLHDAKAGHIAQGIQKVTRGLELIEKAPVPKNGPIAMLYMELAELYDSQGNQQQVEAVLKKMDSMSEGELAVGLARAKICLNHSDDACAQRILRDLSDRYPTNYEVLSSLGNLEFRLKNYAEALDCFERAGAGWFGGALVHISIARSLHALGRDREALDQCRLAETLDPHYFGVKYYCAEIATSNGTR